MNDIAALQDTVYALAKSDSALFAARASGLYRSHDGGVTWHNALVSLPDHETLSATAVVAAGKTILAGVKGAVIRSDDNGDHWQIAGLAAPPPTVTALVLSPYFADDGVAFAGTAEDGVFVSTDRGESWTAWNFGLLDFNVFALAVSPDFVRDNTVYAGTDSGIFISHNGGRAWLEMPFPMDFAPVLSLAVAPGRLYAGTEQHGLFISDDEGVTWQNVEIAPVSSAVNAIHAGSDSAQLWLLAEDALLASADGGQTWRPHPAFRPSDTMAMTMLPDAAAPGAIMVGFAGGAVLQMH